MSGGPCHQCDHWTRNPGDLGLCHWPERTEHPDRPLPRGYREPPANEPPRWPELEADDTCERWSDRKVQQARRAIGALPPRRR